MKVPRWALWVLLFLFIAMQTTVLLAADVPLTWEAPAANADGSTPALVGGYNIYVAGTDAALTALPDTIHGGSANSVGSVLSYTYTNVPPGTYFYAVTTWYCTLQGVCAESTQSPHVSITVAKPVVVPGAPSHVTIGATITAPVH